MYTFSVYTDPDFHNTGFQRIFSLPNRHIRPFLQKPLSAQVRSRIFHFEDTHSFGCYHQPKYIDGLSPGNNTPVMNDDLSRFEKPIIQPIHLRAVSPPAASSPTLHLVTKFVCFLPWCVTVGASLLLCPQYLELVTVNSGYIPSRRAADRMTHWAYHAWHHTVFFLASVLIIVYFQPAIGLTIAALSLGRSVQVWSQFTFDQTIPLGEDDQQSIYRALMLIDYGIDENTVIPFHVESGGAVLWRSASKM